MHTIEEHAAQRDYCYFGDLPADWVVSSIGHSRDSTLLTESNWTAAYNRLESDCGEEGTSNGWEVLRDNHWACGWVEHLTAAPGSKAAALLLELESELEDYPVLDEEAYSAAEHEQGLENISNELGYLGYPKEQAAAVFSWLWDNNQQAVESADDMGAYPDEDALTAACTALGIRKEDEDEEGEEDNGEV